MTSFNRIKVIFILSRGDRNAYQLSKMLSTQEKRLSSGTLFPVLRELENKGFIFMKMENGRKLYSLTEKGKEYVNTLENLRESLRKKLMESYLRDHIVFYEEDDYSLLLSKEFVNSISELNDIMGEEITNLLTLLLTKISRGERGSVERIRDEIRKIIGEENGIH